MTPKKPVIGQKSKLPIYIQHYADLGNVHAYIVNGDWIRTHIDDDFSNFGQHGGFSFIPPNELWIDRSPNPQEYPYWLLNCAVQKKLMDEGKSYDEALSQGDRIEHQARAMSDPMGPVHDLRRQFLGEIPAAHIHVYKVSGSEVRSHIFPDFTEGGHDLVYKWIPPKTVYIDDADTNEDMPFDLFHEIHERGNMLKGMKYDDAHALAVKAENEVRHNPKLYMQRMAQAMASNVEKKSDRRTPGTRSRKD